MLAARNAAVGLAQLLDGEERRPAELPAATPGGGDALLRALRERGALEFGERAHDGVDQPPVRRGRVEIEIGDQEIHAALAQPVEFVERVLGGAIGAVQVPDDEDVTRSQALHDALVDRSPARRRGKRFDMQFVANHLQSVDLSIRLLLARRDAQIGDPARWPFPFFADAGCWSFC